MTIFSNSLLHISPQNKGNIAMNHLRDLVSTITQREASRWPWPTGHLRHQLAPTISVVETNLRGYKSDTLDIARSMSNGLA